MATEDVSARFVDFDGWPTSEAVEAMFEAQLAAVSAVRPALPAIAAAADAAAAVLHRGGRLVYGGAGTSGRIAVQDGAELPPTFDWPLERVIFALAGGETALVRSIEGAEDDREAARRFVAERRVGVGDVVIGLAASGHTPFTVALVEAGLAAGALTIGVANNAGAPLLAAARHPILVETGAEVVAGSTRMKAGTAQKVVLNLLSTAIMVRLGRVYRGLMVNMHVSNLKLQRRAIAMVSALADCPVDSASAALQEAGQDVKTATLVALGLDADEAGVLLDRHQGSLRAALDALGRGGGG